MNTYYAIDFSLVITPLGLHPSFDSADEAAKKLDKDVMYIADRESLIHLSNQIENIFFEKKLAIELEIGYNNSVMICTYKSNSITTIKGEIMGKFESDAKALLQAVGGKDNVAAVSHCATRMRFVLTTTQKPTLRRLKTSQQ